MTEEARIPCSVPFCRRTAPRKGKFANCVEIICGKHYRLAPPTLRARFRRVRRIARRAIMRGDLSTRNRAWALDWKIWNRIKAAVIETAAGVRP